jgi:hypothetical protein
MKNWDNFILLCFNQSIDVEVIQGCKEFIADDYHIKNGWHKDKDMVTSDLGYAELADYTTVEQGLAEIKESIQWSILDFDALGRSREKVLLKKLRKDPGKHIKRVVLKTYWLMR